MSHSKNYIYHLDEFSGSDMIEFQSCDLPERRKFSDPASLYVEDTVFYFYLETLFQKVVSDFDMFDYTVITRNQWHLIMLLDLSSLLDIDTDELQLIQRTLSGIDCWVAENVSEGGSFLVMGV